MAFRYILYVKNFQRTDGAQILEVSNGVILKFNGLIKFTGNSFKLNLTRKWMSYITEMNPIPHKGLKKEEFVYLLQIYCHTPDEDVKSIFKLSTQNYLNQARWSICKLSWFLLITSLFLCLKYIVSLFFKPNVLSIL